MALTDNLKKTLAGTVEAAPPAAEATERKPDAAAKATAKAIAKAGGVTTRRSSGRKPTPSAKVLEAETAAPAKAKAPALKAYDSGEEESIESMEDTKPPPITQDKSSDEASDDDWSMAHESTGSDRFFRSYFEELLKDNVVATSPKAILQDWTSYTRHVMEGGASQFWKGDMDNSIPWVVAFMNKDSPFVQFGHSPSWLTVTDADGWPESWLVLCQGAPGSESLVLTAVAATDLTTTFVDVDTMKKDSTMVDSPGERKTRYKTPPKHTVSQQRLEGGYPVSAVLPIPPAFGPALLHKSGTMHPLELYKFLDDQLGDLNQRDGQRRDRAIFGWCALAEHARPRTGHKESCMAVANGIARINVDTRANWIGKHLGPRFWGWAQQWEEESDSSVASDDTQPPTTNPSGGSRSKANSGGPRETANSGGTREKANSGGSREKTNPSGGSRSAANSGGSREKAESGGTREKANSGGSREKTNPSGGSRSAANSGGSREKAESGGTREKANLGWFPRKNQPVGWRPLLPPRPRNKRVET